MSILNNTSNLQLLLDKMNDLPTQQAPSIAVNSSGLITATAGAMSSTHQLAFQSAKTITPSTASQIAVSSGYYTGGDVMVAGDSNLVAENIRGGVSIFGVNGNYWGGGDTSIEDGLISRTFSVYGNDRISSIGNHAFYSYDSLTSVYFPMATIIGNYAFGNCFNLTSVSFPTATTIGSSAFYNCKGLTSVNFPMATTISDYAFDNCSRLVSVSFPEVKSIFSSAFYNCSSILSVSFPKCTYIGGYTFKNCYKLTSVNFPVATKISNGMFYNCSNLTSVSFPVASEIIFDAFRSCSNLKLVSFPKCNYIGSYAFLNCTNLVSIYLTASSCCSLYHSNAFLNTGIGSTTGSIFVPASLADAYKSATNWTYFSDRIFGV